MDKLLQYSHPAVSKYKLTKYYTLEELQKDGLSLDQIRILFKPVNFTWHGPEQKKEPELVKEKNIKEEQPERVNKSKI